MLAMPDTPVYALETGAADGEKVYVACCDNPKDGVFQQSASLLQSALMDSDCKYAEIDSVADDLLKPARDVFRFHNSEVITTMQDAKKQTASEVESAVKSEEQEMWETLKENNYEFKAHGEEGKLGSKVAGLWQRVVKTDKELAKEYKKRVGFADKSDFRAKWAQGQHERYMGRTEKTTSRTTDLSNGQYLTLQEIAHKEGGVTAGKSDPRAECGGVGKCDPQTATYSSA